MTRKNKRTKSQPSPNSTNGYGNPTKQNKNCSNRDHSFIDNPQTMNVMQSPSQPPAQSGQSAQPVLQVLQSTPEPNGTFTVAPVMQGLAGTQMTPKYSYPPTYANLNTSLNTSPILTIQHPTQQSEQQQQQIQQQTHNIDIFSNFSLSLG